MSLGSRREYLEVVRERYRKVKRRADKSRIIDEVVSTLGHHRKHIVRVLNAPNGPGKPPKPRKRKKLYLEALPAIAIAWEALDFCCAERLHPVLVETVRQLERHGEITVEPLVYDQLSRISRPTLARRLAEMPSPKFRRMMRGPKPTSALRSEIPLGRYDWDEARPGALETDLVEHNGGSSLGHFAYTVNVVDVVSGWSRRRAVLGRGQAGVHGALSLIIRDWPFKPWGMHTDNGSEFLSDQLLRFARTNNLRFTRSQPYRKNDNAHVEQKNLQLVREIVGYARYDTPEDVEWLNRVYDLLDPYANLFLPARKVVRKTRLGSRVRKTYDSAQTPFERLRRGGVLDPETEAALQHQVAAQSPLALHRALENIIAAGPAVRTLSRVAD